MIRTSRHEAAQQTITRQIQDAQDRDVVDGFVYDASMSDRDAFFGDVDGLTWWEQ